MNVRQLFDLTGRLAIITGGSIGVGRQMAEGLAEMGANLVLCARKKERCEQAAREFESLGVRTLALGCDVKNPAEVEAVVDAAISQSVASMFLSTTPGLPGVLQSKKC